MPRHPKTLNGSPKGTAVVMDGGVIPWEPGHHHHFNVAAVPDQLSSIALGWGVLRRGPRAEIAGLNVATCNALNEFVARWLTQRVQLLDQILQAWWKGLGVFQRHLSGG